MNKQHSPLLKKDATQSILASILSIIIGLMVGCIIILIVGLTSDNLTLSSALDGIQLIFGGLFSTGRDAAGNLTFGFNPTNIGNMLFRATPLIMTGLSVAVAFKTGLFNIGAPGQYLMGTMVTLMLALGIPSESVPAGLIWIIALVGGCLAGVFAERSGIINLALEGIMIFGAFIGVLFVRTMQGSEVFTAAAAAGDYATLQGLELMAMVVAALMGAIFSLLLSFASINLRADQTIGGTALNLLAPALVLFLIRIIANQNTLQMAEGDAASWFMIKKAMFGYGRMEDMGPLGETFINRTYLATYLCILLFIVLAIILYKTRFGLRLRACGENPQAADSLGINVYKMRYAGTTISGALAGMGGFVYSLTTANCTANGDVAGFGFLALAVMIFGNWKPLNIAGASLLFGLFKCVAASYSSIDINGDGVYLLADIGISAHFYRMLPYLITLIVLAFTSKNSRAPKAEGIPYDKSSR